MSRVCHVGFASVHDGGQLGRWLRTQWVTPRQERTGTTKPCTRQHMCVSSQELPMDNDTTSDHVSSKIRSAPLMRQTRRHALQNLPPVLARRELSVISPIVFGLPVKNPDLHRAVGLEHVEQSLANHLFFVWSGHRGQRRSVQVREGITVVTPPRLPRPPTGFLGTPVALGRACKSRQRIDDNVNGKQKDKMTYSPRPSSALPCITTTRSPAQQQLLRRSCEKFHKNAKGTSRVAIMGPRA